MKNLSGFVFAVVTAWALTASADLKSADIRINETVVLTNCGGTATLTKNVYGELILSVRNSSCANYQTLLSEGKLAGQGNSGRYVDISISQQAGERPVLIGSNEFIRSGGTNRNSLGDLITVIPPRQARVTTLPRNWSYQYSTDLLEALFGVCKLVDSGNNVVAEVPEDMCFYGSNELPSNMFYDYALNSNQCYIWWSNNERVSGNAVSQEKCN